MKLRAIVYTDETSSERANSIAADFSVPCADGSELSPLKLKQIQALLENQLGGIEGDCAFLLHDGRLQLISFDRSNSVMIAPDFCSPTATYRRIKGGGISQMIAKAAGLRPGLKPDVLDATTGLGGDAFVLASLGCQVTMLERVPEIRALLKSAFQVAQSQKSEIAEIIQRMVLVEQDAAVYLRNLREECAPGVIYLDPMFPQRSKQSLVKKEMRVFHQLVGEDADAGSLLPLALKKARYRVVVKRPKIAPYLNDQRPSHELVGKSNRYDIYTKQKIG